MGRRITTTTPASTTQAPGTSIFDESAFGTSTVVTTTTTLPTAPSTAPPTSPTTTSTTASWPTPPEVPLDTTSTTISVESGITAGTEYPPMPEGSEEEEEPSEGRVVMKERPSTFGDQNLAKTEIEPGLLRKV
ncbi:hypothetical protein COOONC_18110 [Cooperia oncophora]